MICLFRAETRAASDATVTSQPGERNFEHISDNPSSHRTEACGCDAATPPMDRPSLIFNLKLVFHFRHIFLF